MGLVLGWKTWYFDLTVVYFKNLYHIHHLSEWPEIFFYILLPWYYVFVKKTTFLVKNWCLGYLN
jgi:hypothetical protein